MTYVQIYLHIRGHPCPYIHLISEDFHIGRMAARNKWRLYDVITCLSEIRYELYLQYGVLPAKFGNIGTGECPRAIHGPGHGIDYVC